MDSILLIGQSNMSGRGYFDDNNKPIYNDRIKKLVNGRFQTMWEPVSPDRSFAGASLAPAFALEYLKYTAEPFGLIPASDGGSALDEWQKGEVLYEHAVFLAKMAMRKSRIVAVLWHQGEADCRGTLAETYKERFVRMKDDMKKDLGLPDVKFYVGGLGDYLAENEKDPALHDYARLNTLFAELAKENADVEYVSAEGLADRGDKLHFDTPSLRTFGRRYFAAFLADHPDMRPLDYVPTAEKPIAEQLAEKKKQYDAGTITYDEYDAFIKKYIATL